MRSQSFTLSSFRSLSLHLAVGVTVGSFVPSPDDWLPFFSFLPTLGGGTGGSHFFFFSSPCRIAVPQCGDFNWHYQGCAVPCQPLGYAWLNMNFDRKVAAVLCSALLYLFLFVTTWGSWWASLTKVLPTLVLPHGVAVLLLHKLPERCDFLQKIRFPTMLLDRR